jgi:hypothetical protein
MTNKSSVCHHEEKPFAMNHDGGAMISVTQVAETLRQILEAEANQLAKDTGFIQRERTISGADFAQTLIFGWLEEPEISLDGMTQVAGRRDVEITASGWHQRFTPEAVTFLERLLERLTQVRLQAEAAPVALLNRFTAVIVEDSSSISFPEEVVQLWRGVEAVQTAVRPCSSSLCAGTSSPESCTGRGFRQGDMPMARVRSMSTR